jgi:hypothetical protein
MIFRIKIALLVALVALLLVELVKLASAQPVSLNPSAWSIRYSPGMPTRPNAAPVGWQFAFPLAAAGTCPAPDTQPPNFNVSRCHHVDYVTAAYTKAITGTSISMLFSVTTGPGTVFDWKTQFENTCPGEATVRLLIEHRNDASLSQPTYRWWSNPVSFPLAPVMNMTLTVPLTPDQWSDVNGQFGNTNAQTLAGFKAALAQVGAVGMTFGGGCFFGHGVYLDSGSATFNLQSYTIN